MMTVFRTTAKQLRDLIKVRMYRPSHLRLGLRDFFDLRPPTTAVYDNSIHLRAAMDWLCRAQDATPEGGAAARYRLSIGWSASYPETTGYIIPTFFDYAALTNDETFRHRALRMVDWLLSVQFKSGDFIQMG